MKKILFATLLIAAVTSVGFAQNNIYLGDSSYLPCMGEDVPEKMKEEITNVFVWMRGIRGSGSTTLHRKIFGGDVAGPVYINWFRQRLKQIRIDPSECRDIIAVLRNRKPAACAMPDLPGQRHVAWFVPDITRFEGSLLLSTLVHEAQHLSPEGRHPHIACRSNGNKDCDSDELGAYTASAVFISNVMHYCINCNDPLSKHVLSGLAVAYLSALRRLDGQAHQSFQENINEMK